MREVFQIFIISVALAADAMSAIFAVGMRAREHNQKQALRLSLPFGFFQGTMTLLGWAIGQVLSGSIASFGTIIGFILLTIIGLKTIWEGISKDENVLAQNLSASRILMLSIATSIDALVVGATIAIFDLPVVLAAIFIGLTTFILCYLTYFSSKHFGKYFGEYVEVVGGIVLILIGISLVIF